MNTVKTELLWNCDW